MAASSEAPTKGGGGDPGPSEPEQPRPDEPGLPFRLRYLILLLAEYGGIYGTAAVLLSVVTHVDAFGALHWDTGNVLLGLGLYAPVLLFDAVVGLPDWTSRPEDSARLLRLFFDPTTAVVVSGAAADGGAAPPSGGSTAANTGTVRVTLAAAAGGGSGSSAVPVPAEDDAAAAPPSGLWVASQRVRMAMELLQEQYIRNNPGSRLAPLQELMVLVVACLADEMLYRAVGLTLFSLWLRDRFYEAGADDIIGLPPLLGGAALELPTPDAAKWAALAVGASVGAAVYGLNAWREASMASSAAEASAAAAKKSFATSRLDPGSPGARSLERQAEIDAIRASLSAAIGLQGVLVWTLEGAREITQVAASGAAFILTGNLAAPLAGNLVSQMLFCTYQRIGLKRSLERRVAAMAERKARAAAARAAGAPEDDAQQ